MKQNPPAALALQPDGAAQRRGAFRALPPERDLIGDEDRVCRQLHRLEVLDLRLKRLLRLKLVEDFLLAPDAARASEFSEVPGQQRGNGLAVTAKLRAQELFFKRLNFILIPQNPAAFPKLCRLS